MNEYDTEVAEGLLAHQGYEIVPDALETGPCAREVVLNADVFVMNTCAVREHAEERVYGRLGMLGKYKKANPDLIIGLMGCMVEEHQEKLFQRFPQLDFMVGTRNIKELPALIDRVTKTRQQVASIKRDGLSIEYTDLIKRASRYQAWLPIMTGCNKVCTFCIVPITRGAEVSMPAREVYREAGRLVSEGVKWITLLGQNVNSYSGGDKITGDKMQDTRYKILDAKHKTQAAHDKGQNANQIQSSLLESSILNLESTSLSKVSADNFPQLLEMLCQIEGLDRISFTTSHPQDATEELFQVIARNPKISRRFHLPLQSGSDAVLKRMKRLHTYADYKQKIDRLRALVPDIAVTTDIIAGFSGETEADHESTLRALEEIRYDSAYIFKYSLRAQTPAARLADDVPLEKKERRNAQLLEIQRKISREKYGEWVGRTVEVFAEAVNSRDKKQLVGWTADDKKVVFEGDPSLVGSFMKVQLLDLNRETLIGKLGGGDDATGYC